MSTLSGIPEEIKSFCSALSDSLSGLSDGKAMIDCAGKALPSLLVQKEFFARILRNYLEGSEYPSSRDATMFDNELLLYADPNRLYSLRLFLWESKEYTQVHDHNSWGVIGPVVGEFDVIDYEREDDRSHPEVASLKEKARMRLRPGETAFTLPLDAGIHRVGNPTEKTMVSLSLYGNPLPRGYINGFDLEKGRVYRIMSQKMRKKLLAVKALPGLDEKIAHTAVEKACNHPLEVIRVVGHAARKHMK